MWQSFKSCQSPAVLWQVPFSHRAGSLNTDSHIRELRCKSLVQTRQNRNLNLNFPHPQCILRAMAIPSWVSAPQTHFSVLLTEPAYSFRRQHLSFAYWGCWRTLSCRRTNSWPACLLVCYAADADSKRLIFGEHRSTRRTNCTQNRGALIFFNCLSAKMRHFNLYFASIAKRNILFQMQPRRPNTSLHVYEMPCRCLKKIHFYSATIFSQAQAGHEGLKFRAQA